MSYSGTYRGKTSKTEFADTTRRQAGDALRRMFQQDASIETDPVLKLIVFLLEDGAGGIQPPIETPVTTEQWFTWNRLLQGQPRAVALTMTRVLEREQVALPADTTAMRTWAAQLLLSTLDRLGML